MRQWTNSNIRRTVTDMPFLHANMSKCTFNPKKINPTGIDTFNKLERNQNDEFWNITRS